MLPIIIAAGAAMLLNELFKEFGSGKNKRAFVSFAMEDKKYRNFLVAQAKNDKTPFSFVDMSVKQPWDQKEWREKCRTKIKSCDGVIVLLSSNTLKASGARWEIKCAREEGIPIVGVQIQKDAKGKIPPELKGKKVIIWSWDNLEKIIDSF